MDEARQCDGQLRLITAWNMLETAAGEIAAEEKCPPPVRANAQGCLLVPRNVVWVGPVGFVAGCQTGPAAGPSWSPDAAGPSGREIRESLIRQFRWNFDVCRFQFRAIGNHFCWQGLRIREASVWSLS